MTHLVGKNLWKEYGDQVILERVNVEVNGPAFITIVGASGCGKTTFLRMLLGEESPSRGELLLDGSPLPDEPGPERGIVFQRYSVFPHLSVLHNVMFGLELRGSRMFGRLFGASRRWARETAEATLASVGLHEHRNKYPSALSGGMQQRLAIAQSIIMKPRVLLLDEPFGALDPGIRGDMHELVRNLWAQTRMTVFMVTHDIQEAFDLGTRVLVFDKTRLDLQAPGAYGATITYDISLDRKNKFAYREIEEQQRLTERFSESVPLETASNPQRTPA